MFYDNNTLNKIIIIVVVVVIIITIIIMNVAQKSQLNPGYQSMLTAPPLSI